MTKRKAARTTGKKPRTAKAAAPKRKASKAKTPKPVSLPAECVIASAPDLRDVLLKRVGEAGNVQIDASAVQRVDTASLQVMAAFVRDRRNDGLSCEWLSVPTCLTEAATLLDLTNALGLGSPGSSVTA
jgi:phospholipid transport system transporter-binding protein